MRRWASSCLKPLEYETAFLVLPRKGIAIVPKHAATAAVGSSPA